MPVRTFTVDYIAACASGEHLRFEVMSGGDAYPLVLSRAEILAGSDASIVELVIQRIKSFVAENHAGDWPATIAALEAATLKV